MKKVLSLGGGVQSSTVLYMSCLGELPKLDCAVFADTHWEPAEVYAHLDRLCEFAAAHNLPVHRVSAGDLRSDALRSNVGSRWASMPFFTRRVWTDKDSAEIEQAIEDTEFMGRSADKLKKLLGDVRRGMVVDQKGMIKRQCTKEYKIEPIARFIKQHVFGMSVKARWPKEVILQNWFGISYDERQRCRGSSHRWSEHVYPLVDRLITRQGCIHWLETHGLPIPPRSACLGCPFHSDAEWRDMKANRPDEFENACQFDEAIRKCGGLRGDTFLHRSCHPLRDVDFRSDADKGQLYLLDGLETKGCDSGNCFI